MTRTAVVAGVGPGLGGSIVERFVDAGCTVGAIARTGGYLDRLEDAHDDAVLGIRADVTDPSAVSSGFEVVRDRYGPIDILVFNPSYGNWKGLESITPDEFEASWRVSAYGALLCAQEAVVDMRDRDGGTIIFTGATSALRGRDGAIGFSAAKFAARGMAESMARELGPAGIHVAHVIIDGQIRRPDVGDRYPNRGEETFLDPNAIADAYWTLVEQDRSAWTLELDLRPHVEEF